MRGGAKTPFKGVILSGNLFDLLGRVQAVGKDLTFYGTYGSRAACGGAQDKREVERKGEAGRECFS